MLRLIISLSIVICFIKCKTKEVMVVDQSKWENLLQYQKTCFDEIEAHTVNGGYMGIIDIDKGKLYGEGLFDEAVEGDIKISDPGTVDIAQRYLNLYKNTNEIYLLQRVEEIADLLMNVQTEYGGWSYWGITKDNRTASRSRGTNRIKNLVSFDEGTTPNVLMFFIDLYKVKKEAKYLQVIENVTDLIIRAQNPDGGWPQYYPSTGLTYALYSSFNDETSNKCLKVLLQANEILNNKRIGNSINRFSAFILDSQYPSGGWAQQYDENNKATKARENEPAGLTSSTTAFCIKSLFSLYKTSNNPLTKERYRTAILKASSWLQKVKLNDNTWARFYNTESLKPIFIDYQGKSYDSYEEALSNKTAFKGYAFAGNFNIPSLLINIERWKKMGDTKYFNSLENRSYTFNYILAQSELVLQDLKNRLNDKNDNNYWRLNDQIRKLDLILTGQRFLRKK